MGFYGWNNDLIYKVPTKFGFQTGTIIFSVITSCDEYLNQ